MTTRTSLWLGRGVVILLGLLAYQVLELIYWMGQWVQQRSP